MPIPEKFGIETINQVSSYQTLAHHKVECQIRALSQLTHRMLPVVSLHPVLLATNFAKRKSLISLMTLKVNSTEIYNCLVETVRALAEKVKKTDN